LRVHGKSKGAVIARVVAGALVAGVVLAGVLVAATGLPVVVAYVLGFGLITFLTYGYDKFRAVRQGRRVPNAALRWLAVLGGAAGGVAGMLVWRHKINHASFWIAQAVGGIVIVAALWATL
jgi:uncharacterized membrane protein YsdA (DUF1294 family)